MIVSDSRKQAFCHIPKNGGSSVRKHYMKTWSDHRVYQGRREVDALNGKLRDLTHISPLEAMQYFHDDLIGRGYKITTIIRSPIPRAASALLQYVRSFGPENKNFIDVETVKNTLESKSVPELCEASRTDYRCIFFRPQVDFLFGVPEASQDLIDFENLSATFPNLPVENRGGRIPNFLQPLSTELVKRVANNLPQSVKGSLLKALVRRSPEINLFIKEEIDKERAFLEEFYRLDQELYEKLARK